MKFSSIWMINKIFLFSFSLEILITRTSILCSFCWVLPYNLPLRVMREKHMFSKISKKSKFTLNMPGKTILASFFLFSGHLLQFRIKTHYSANQMHKIFKSQYVCNLFLAKLTIKITDYIYLVILNKWYLWSTITKSDW